MQRRAARRSPVVASSSGKAGPVVQHPYYTAGKQRDPTPKEGIWRTGAESPPHQSPVDRLGSRTRQNVSSVEDLFTAVPRPTVQPSSASGDCIQYGARAKRHMSEEKFDELMNMGYVYVAFELEAREAAAAEAAIEAEAELVENADALSVRLQCSYRIIRQQVLVV